MLCHVSVLGATSLAQSTDPRPGVATISANVSALMGTAARQWSLTRKALIDKGMVVPGTAGTGPRVTQT